MSFVNHKLFPKLQPYIRIEPVNDTRRPRVRIEFNPMSEALLAQAQGARMSCVACGARIRFIRDRLKGGRKPTNHRYFAPTCPLDTRVGCSRGQAARNEYIAVKTAVAP